MKKQAQIKANLDLLGIFMKYAFEHPDILDKIPSEAELVILPENEPEMYQENMKLVEKLKKTGKPFVVVRMKLPEAIPEPTIELMAG